MDFTKGAIRDKMQCSLKSHFTEVKMNPDEILIFPMKTIKEKVMNVHPAPWRIETVRPCGIPFGGAYVFYKVLDANNNMILPLLGYHTGVVKCGDEPQNLFENLENTLQFIIGTVNERTAQKSSK